MDLSNVTRIFVNTPLIQNNTKVTGVLPIQGVVLPTQIEGSLSVLHTINQGSEIRLSFSVVPSYHINTLRSLFLEGSLHDYDNNKYIVTNYGETTDTQPLQQYGLITTYQVEVVLLVYSYLKAQVSVRLQYPSTGTSFISVHNIATKAGVAYNGFDFQIPVTKDSADTYYTFSLASEINTRAWEFQQTVVYGYDRITTQGLGRCKPIVGEISPVEVSGSPPTQYKNAVVSWANNTLSPFRNDPIYMEPVPSVIYLVEGDTDITQPPDNIGSFRDQKGAIIGSIGLNDPDAPTSDNDLDEQSGTWYQATRALYMVFDNGGQTKEVRVTKKVDGVTEYTESIKYGFMFTAYKLAASGGSPADYWQPIEYKKTVYTYEKVERDFDSIRYQDRAGIWRTTVVSPALKNLLAKSNVGYLTKTETTGYRFLRFQNEQQAGWDILNDTSIAGSVFWQKRLYAGIGLDGNGNTTGEANYCRDMLNLYLFRKIPIYAQTQYYLVESESIYDDTYVNNNKEVNANIEKVKWSDLPEQLRNTTSPDSEGYVGIARPDPDSYKEYLVMSERTEDISLAWITNPLAKLYDAETQTAAKRQPTIAARKLPSTYMPSLEPYVIGENTTTNVERKIVPNRNTRSTYVNQIATQDGYKLSPKLTYREPSYGNSSDRIDRYVEYTTTKTIRGVGLQEQVSMTTFTESEGRPPLATVQRTAALQADIQRDPFYKTDREYYYTCLIDSDYPTDDTTGSFSMLEIKQSDLTGTRRAIDYRVALENALSTKELTVELGYYRPEYKVGCLTTIPIYEQQWLITRVEHGFDFKGAFITKKPTKLTLGAWLAVQSEITTSQFAQQDFSRLPYNSNKYKVVGGSYPLSLNKGSDTPLLTGDRGNEQPTLSGVYI